VATVDIWTYREQTWAAADLTGYDVEAVDGGIGKIDEASNEVGAGYIVVDTGPWIYGKKVLLPAGVISRVDRDDEKVYVNRTKEQIKNAPEFDEDNYRDDAYRSNVGSYYDQGGPAGAIGSSQSNPPKTERPGGNPGRSSTVRRGAESFGWEAAWSFISSWNPFSLRALPLRYEQARDPTKR
jgi:hypothetical protein